MDPSAEAPDDLAALRLVIEGTVSETGSTFFRGLVKNLAAVMATAGAWVTEYLPGANRLRARAFWLDGRFIENYEHGVPGTPCEAVLTERRLVHFPDRILDLFPDDPDLRSAGAVSYMGVPLFDADGEIMGHLAVLDTKPLPSEPRLLSLFEIFAARAAAECRRLRAQQQLRESEEELAAVLRSAMDGIVVFDESMRIVRTNPAAERLTGYPDRELCQKEMKWFLAGDSAKLLARCVADLAALPRGDRQMWIPSHLSVLRADGSRFPAEATLSCYDCRGARCHTLILRSIDERLEAERRIARLTSEADYLRDALEDASGIGELLGKSRVMQDLKTAIQQVAATDATVVIHGETGTGKELVARAIHTASRRADRPMVRVNCAAIPGTLMESEFFGHEKGAFTGAVARRYGRFALADGGTIFLDEIGELPLDLQAKLLRVLQEGEFEPLGGTRTRKVNVRVIAATNRDLAEMVSKGTFREDLFYRLNVFPVTSPPLRERGGDIALLAKSFQERFARRMGRRLDPLHPEDARRLAAYDWPGNIRELQNVIERAIILSHGTRPDLMRAMPAAAVPPPAEPAEENDTPRILTVRELEEIERENIRRALTAAGGKISGSGGAAELLGTPPSTFSSRMKALGVARG